MYINDEAQRQVLPILAKTAIAPTTEAQERAGSLLQMNPGQQVKAEIVANLPNSLFLARIAGELYKLEIPLNVAPGETLELTFLTAEPRITFQVMQQPVAGAMVRLSSMGKWLAEVVENAGPLEGMPETLMESPLFGAELLSGRLKELVALSGLFYEAHLAQWAAGGLPLAELLKEPQGKLSRVAGEKGEEGEAGDKVDGGFADSQTLPLIKEQLALLNSGVFSWKGNAWPGQQMEIAIAEREAEEWDSGVEATLALELPNLGGVRATVTLGGDGLAIELTCDGQGGAEVLRNGGDGLRAALASSGVQLTRMAVKDGEAA